MKLHFLKMKYYNIRAANSTKVKGVNGYQIKSPGNNYNHWGKTSVRYLGRLSSGFNAETVVDIPNMEIERNAILTDVLTSGILRDFFQGITMSDHFIEFLKEYKIPKYKLFRLKLFQSTIKVNNYQRFVILEDGLDFIDYSESVFTFIENKWEKDPGIQIYAKSYDDIAQYHKAKTMETLNNKLEGTRIVLIKEFDFDIFRLDYFGGYYVSRKLKEGIENNGFTGMRFEEVPNII